MNIKQLEVFLAVAKTGSFSKGAAATFITQSTVSQQIKAKAPITTPTMGFKS